jgi:hypothetical protein
MKTLELVANRVLVAVYAAMVGSAILYVLAYTLNV